LGRRVARRRAELGLSIDQLANRSGMAPEYIDYVEHHATSITAEALVRLAAGLETSSGSLLGEGVDVPSGNARAGSRPRLEALTEHECRTLLGPGGVGRVVFTTDHGPEALPVNYTVVGESVVFRTAPDTPLAAVVDTDVGFEVDRLDEAFSEGWSVLVSGPAKRVREPAVIWRLADVVEPWAGGDRNVFIRIDPHRVTGRRIRSGTGDL
jgi:hypothetical protein